MYKNIYIKHIENPEYLSIEDENCIIFSTCVRKVIFYTAKKESTLSGTEALSLLIEIISGLHSPFIGETEVQGQFRTFVKEAQDHPLFMELQPFFQTALAISRKLRRDYLSEIKPPTYALSTRKLLGKVDKIAVIGRGDIAQQIFRYYNKKQTEVLFFSNIYSNRLIPAGMEVRSLNDLTNFKTNALIIASPILNSDITISNKEATVIDFRDKHTPINKALWNKIYYLEDVHSILKNENKEIELIRNEALVRIKELIFDYKNSKLLSNLQQELQ